MITLPASGRGTRRRSSCDGCGRPIMTSRTVVKTLCHDCAALETAGVPLRYDRPVRTGQMFLSGAPPAAASVSSDAVGGGAS